MWYEGGAREKIKKIILGMLSWRFSLMSQFDRMDEGNVFPDPKWKCQIASVPKEKYINFTQKKDI